MLSFVWKRVNCGSISEGLRDGAKALRDWMICKLSPIDKYRYDPCPLRGVAGRNQNDNFFVCNSFFVSRHSAHFSPIELKICNAHSCWPGEVPFVKQIGVGSKGVTTGLPLRQFWLSSPFFIIFSLNFPHTYSPNRYSAYGSSGPPIVVDIRF